MGEVRVVGIRVEQPQNQPVLLLRESDGDRYLPIWIGAVEATAIAYEQQGVKPARPLTHDLLRDMHRERGLTSMVLSSSTTMHAAHRLYERLGFTRLPERDWSPVPGVQLVAYALPL